MRLLIVGPGAMGCLFAGLLSETGHEVTILDKNQCRADTINLNGITIVDGETSRTLPVRVTADPRAIEKPDLLCLFVKSFDTRSAIEHAISAIGPETNIATFQNGIANAEIISEYIDANRIICGVTSQGSTSLGIGHVRHAGRGPTFVAPLTVKNAHSADALAELLTSSGIRTTVKSGAKAMMWSKLIINAAINPLTALSKVSNGKLLEDDELRTAMYSVAREAQQVALALGIQLSYEDGAEEAEKICMATSDNISSMLQDIQNGKQTEIDFITGAIVREAHHLGISVPGNEILLEAINKQTRQAQ